MILSSLLLLALAVPPSLPRYPGAQAVPVARGVELAGQRLWLAAFSTPDDGERVARFYAEAFEREGLPAMVDGRCRSACVVAAFRTREGLVEAAVIQRGEDRTLVYLALQSLWYRAPPVAPPAAVEGVLLSSEVVAEGENEGKDVPSGVRISVFRGTPAQVEEAEVRRRVTAGEQVVSRLGQTEDGTRRVELRRGRLRVHLWLRDWGPGHTVVETVEEAR